MKVVLQSITIASVAFVVYRFMSQVDSSHLDLDSPVSLHVLCLSEWPLVHVQDSWWKPQLWVDSANFRLDMAEFVDNHMCASPPLQPQRCENASMPFASMSRNLGVALGAGYDVRNDAIEFYGYLFFYMGLWLWLSVNIHDLALISGKERDYILDLHGMRIKFPCAGKLFRCTGVNWLQNVAESYGRLGRLCVALVLPFLVIWSVFLFIFIVLPLLTVCFIRYPIRLSRGHIFCMCLSLTIFGLILTIHMAIVMAIPKWRQSYAVTWPSGNCICGCAYRLTGVTCSGMLFIGLGVIYNSLMLAFRCLKGLRQSNWANLMSVMFPIPLTVYSVEWTRPDKEPIQHRKRGEPVQGELAFDPFALMDEQTDSARTTVNLVPTLYEEVQIDASRHLDGPAPYVKGRTSTRSELSSPSLQEREDQLIGCCGFPCGRAQIHEKADQKKSEVESTQKDESLGHRSRAGDAASAECLDDVGDASNSNLAQPPLATNVPTEEVHSVSM